MRLANFAAVVSIPDMQIMGLRTPNEIRDAAITGIARVHLGLYVVAL